MEGGELFQRIQQKQAFNERGKNTLMKICNKSYLKLVLVFSYGMAFFKIWP